jgi:hypothetical protein
VQPKFSFLQEIKEKTIRIKRMYLIGCYLHKDTAKYLKIKKGGWGNREPKRKIFRNLLSKQEHTPKKKQPVSNI